MCCNVRALNAPSRPFTNGFMYNSTDFTCVCGSAQFQSDAGSCIQSICPDQLASALGLQQQACNASTYQSIISHNLHYQPLTLFSFITVGITATGLATSGTFTQTDLSLVSSGTAAASVSSESGSGSGTSSGSKTGSSSGTTSKATSTAPTSSSAGASATSSAPNSASAKAVFGYGGVVAFGVAVVGMVVGGGVLAL